MSAAKNPKSSTGGVIERLGALRDGIRQLFKVIRTSRIVLRHLEACLIELWGVSHEDIETASPPQLHPPTTTADAISTVVQPD